MKKTILIITGIIILVLIGYFGLKGKKSGEGSELFAYVKGGTFRIEIETTGELEAMNSTKILGPARLRDFRIYNVAINKIVEEGTVVRKGDWVASLDPSELESKVQDAQLEVDKMQSQFIQTQLDTTLQMRQARDELINLQYAVIEREIELEQSEFEPPATQRKADMNLEKAQRTLQQAKENYKIREDQNKAKMAEVAVNLMKERRDFQGMQEIMDKFTILAPKDGMVIYKKGFDGKPMKEGSTISAWDPTVAELPDLSVMISKTYVNEVDIRKIKPGQHVEIGLDAFPEKRLSGTVIRVANVGEQRPNSDAKVFMVTVRVHGRDELLRPAMTTSNKIVTNVIDSTLYIPLECLHTEFDSINFVYKREGLNTIKQEIMVGETNVNEAIVKAGLNKGDKLYLSIPSGFDNRQIVMIPEMDGKRSQPEPLPNIADIPTERTITLPDGRTITMPANGTGGRQRRFQNRQSSGDERGSVSDGNNTRVIAKSDDDSKSADKNNRNDSPRDNPSNKN